MLGNHADYFMFAQMRERVHAIGPNAGGQSLNVPDRERAGTAHVTAKGGYGMPGPQRVVSSGFMPGIGGVAAPPPLPSGAIPGMGGGALPGMSGGALPGMSGGALPGMSGLDTKTVGLLALGAGVLYLVLKK
jgi:hypothetical protein